MDEEAWLAVGVRGTVQRDDGGLQQPRLALLHLREDADHDEGDAGHQVCADEKLNKKLIKQ